MKRTGYILLLIFCVINFFYSQTEQENKIYDIVDVRPEFPGGEIALLRFLAENINYPQSAIDSGIQGTIFIKFIVEVDGRITNVEVIRGIGGGCDEEAIRVVQTMPKWTPGIYEGNYVRSRTAIPIRFVIPSPTDRCNGTVYLSFSIDTNYNLPHTFVQRGINDFCDELAITLLQEWLHSVPRLSTNRRSERIGIRFVPGQKPEVITEKDFIQIDPEFPGGEVARLNFLMRNVRYPREARERGIQGTVFVSFVVEKDGSISNILAEGDVGGGLGEEAVRVIKAMPKWNPGLIDGYPIRSQFVIPIRFVHSAEKNNQRNRQRNSPR